MGTIELLRDHSETALKLALEENLLQYVKTSVLPEEDVLDSGEVFRWYCGSNMLLRNWVLNPKFTSENAYLKVKEQMDYFKKRKVTFLWWNGPSAEPSNLGEVMRDAGMMKFELPPRSGDMVLDIRNSGEMEKNLTEIMDKTGIQIRKIRSMEDIKEGVQLAIKTGGFSEKFRQPGEKSCELMIKEDPDVNVLVGYVAYLDNTPVSISTVFYGAGVAGLYSVGTLKKLK